MIVRDLRTGDETKFAVPGLLRRAWFSDDGNWLMLTAAVRDDDGDGRIALPQPERTLGPRVCWGMHPVHDHRQYEQPGDNLVLFVAPVTGGRLRGVSEAIGPVGDRLLVRRGDPIATIDLGVLGRSHDGRVLRVARPPAKIEPAPRPASEPDVIDFSPVREMLPDGPLLWRVAE